MLLLFCSEEHAFYILCSICEILVPDYYVKAMIGSIVDQRIFEELVNERLPKIADRLQEVFIPMQLISLPWFLCLFIGYVPLEVRKYQRTIVFENCSGKHQEIEPNKWKNECRTKFCIHFSFCLVQFLDVFI